MKKYLLFLFVITLLSFNINTTSAVNCAPGDLFNTATGQACNTTTMTAECKSGDLFSSITGKPCGTKISTLSSTPVLSCPQFSIGTKGENVKVFQIQLNSQGASLKVDGSYGPLTQVTAEKYCKTPTTSSLVINGANIPQTSVNTTTKKVNQPALSCSTLKQTQQLYFTICKDSNYENVCFSKESYYQGCFNGTTNACTTNSVNGATNILCSTGGIQTPVTPTDTASGSAVDWSKVSGRLQNGFNFTGFIEANKEQVFQIYLPEDRKDLMTGIYKGMQVASRVDVLLKDGGVNCDKPLPTGADLEMIRKKWLEKNPQFKQYEMNLTMSNLGGKDKVGEGDGYFYDFWHGGTYGSLMSSIGQGARFHKGCYWLLVYNKYEGAKETVYDLAPPGGQGQMYDGRSWYPCNKQRVNPTYQNCIALDPPSPRPYVFNLNNSNYGEPTNHNPVTLTWSADENYISCQASGYDWTGAKERSGSTSVLPPLIPAIDQTVSGFNAPPKPGTPYTLSCLGKDGIERKRTKYLYNFADVVPKAHDPAAVINSFEASATTIKAGGSVNFSWSSSGATKCAINSAPLLTSACGVYNSGALGTQGARSVTPGCGAGTSVRYQLNCSNATDDPTYKYITVNITTPTASISSAPTCSITLSPKPVVVGQNANVSWTSTGLEGNWRPSVTVNCTGVIPFVNNAIPQKGSTPFIFPFAGSETCSLVVKNDAGLTGTCSDSVNVTSVLGATSFKFTQFLEEGAYGNEVVELQKYLNGIGYDVGSIDGIFGVKVKMAVFKFQIANNLKSDGIVGSEVRALLNK
ncbi:MAG: peptidoglycan-binding domain-containing protein [Candidatus Paceibacterota bacterium]|jgi:hypothetical protein